MCVRVCVNVSEKCTEIICLVSVAVHEACLVLPYTYYCHLIEVCLTGFVPCERTATRRKIDGSRVVLSQ